MGLTREIRELKHRFFPELESVYVRETYVSERELTPAPGQVDFARLRTHYMWPGFPTIGVMPIGYVTISILKELRRSEHEIARIGFLGHELSHIILGSEASEEATDRETIHRRLGQELLEATRYIEGRGTMRRASYGSQELMRLLGQAMVIGDYSSIGQVAPQAAQPAPR
jgi:hypothetical protein